MGRVRNNLVERGREMGWRECGGSESELCEEPEPWKSPTVDW